MTKPTPGDWVVFGGPGAGNVGSRKTSVWSANGDHLIAECHRSKTINIQQQQANAKLIAAAPALKQVLQEVVDDWDANPEWPVFVRAVAILKALDASPADEAESTYTEGATDESV